MAIEIIDGFKVNSAVPVDNRIVASGSTARNAINYKYEGLRVFDTSDSIPYVWLNNTWEKENNTALSIPSGVTPGFTNTISYRSGQILKVYNSNKLLTNSNMFEVEFLDTLGSITSKSIAINHSTAASVSSTSKLDVNGSIKATSFEGSGANITNIDPVNFNTTINKIKNTQIDHGANGYILQTVDDGLGNLSVQWKNPSIIISPSSVSTRIETNDVNINYLTFVPSTGVADLLVSVGATQSTLGFIPQTGQLLVKGGSPLKPSFTFLGETNSGFYRSGAGTVAISILGNKKIEIDNNGLKVNAGNATNPGLSFIGGSNYGMYQTTSGSNRIGIVVAGNEMIRIKSSSTQGNGNTSIYGDGNVLALQGRGSGGNGVYMEFYRSGSDTPDVISTRGAWIGYSSGLSSDFTIANSSTQTYVSLVNTGAINISSKKSNDFGLYIENIASNGQGMSVRNNNGESLRMASKLTSANYLTFYDNSITTTPSGYTIAANSDWGLRTSWIGHWTASGGNDVFNISHDSTGGKIVHRVGGVIKMETNYSGVKMMAFESYALPVPTITVINNSGNANNTFNGANSACINAVYKTLSSNSGTYTARWIYLGFKFNSYTGSTKSSQTVTFAADTCDRMFYCGVGGNSPSNWYGYEAKFYIGGTGNGNQLGRFLSNNGSSQSIYNGSGSFYVPAGHVFTITFEWYGDSLNPINDSIGDFGMNVRAFRMGLN